MLQPRHFSPRGFHMCGMSAQAIGDYPTCWKLPGLWETVRSPGHWMVEYLAAWISSAIGS
jgi:hypothetical protein